MDRFIDKELTKKDGFVEILLFKKLHIVYQWQTDTMCHSAYNSKYGGKDLDKLILDGKVRVTVFCIS
jgi:hypothetical protein